MINFKVESGTLILCLFKDLLLTVQINNLKAFLASYRWELSFAKGSWNACKNGRKNRSLLIRSVSVFNLIIFRRRLPSFPKPYRGIEPRSLTDQDQIDSIYKKLRNIKQSVGSLKKHRKKHHHKPRSLRSISITRTFESDESAFLEEPSPDEFKDGFSLSTDVENKVIEKKEFLESWLKRLHFVTISVYDFGNWIPLVTSRWHGRVLDQITFEGKAGNSFIPKCSSGVLQLSSTQLSLLF